MGSVRQKPAAQETTGGLESSSGIYGSGTGKVGGSSTVSSDIVFGNVDHFQVKQFRKRQGFYPAMRFAFYIIANFCNRHGRRTAYRLPADIGGASF